MGLTFHQKPPAAFTWLLLNQLTVLILAVYHKSKQPVAIIF